MSSVCLGVQPFMQPSPKKNLGGDCFACALTATLRHLYKKPDLSFDECWDCFMVETHGGGRGLSNSWPGMRSALYAADDRFREFGRLDIISDIVEMRFEPDMWSHTWFGGVAPTVGYARRLEAWLRAGYIAFCEIDFSGRGPVVDGRWNTSDHFVVVDGVSTFWRRHESIAGAASLDHEIHVVCSARGAYWIPVKDWLFKHGAAGWWLVRLDEREYR